jgi:ABC-2 type transport system permease protein
MSKYFRLAHTFVRTCIVEELQYRAHFFSNVLMSILLLALSVLTVQLYFYRAPVVGGWSFAEVLILLGVFKRCKVRSTFFSNRI